MMSSSSGARTSSSPGSSTRNGRYAPIAPLQQRPMQSDPVSSAEPTKRVRLACQQCRQSKLRCNSKGADQSCERCNRMSLECIYDNSYRRANKRVKIEELVDEVQQLRSAVQNNALPYQQSHSPELQSISAQSPGYGAPRTRRSNVGISLPAGSTVDTLDQSSLGASLETSPRANQQDRVTATAAVHTRSLEDTVIHPSQIDRLFDVYFASYHPFFPVLDPGVSADDYYNWSPSLFWAIIMTGARRDEEDTTLMAVLHPKVRRLHFQAIADPPHNRCTIKAWIIVCLWSFPVNSMTKDPSYMLISAAKASAMHVGLHRPEIVQDYSRIKIRFGHSELQDAIKTWVGCFIAAESICSSIGHPSLFGSDHTLNYLATHPQADLLPDELMVFMQACRFTNRANRMMSGQEEKKGRLLSAEISVLLPMLEHELNELYSQIAITSVATEMLLLFTSLQFRCYYFFEELGLPSRKEGLLKGYAAALSLAFRGKEAQSSSRFFSHAPGIFHYSVMYAAMFIMKIAKSSYARDIDMAEAKKGFSICHVLIKQMSLENDDIRGRSAKIFEQLWNSPDPELMNSEPTLKLRSRLGGSLLHDTIWTWREKFGCQKSTQPTDPASTSGHTGTANSVQNVVSQAGSQDGQDYSDVQMLNRGTMPGISPQAHGESNMPITPATSDQSMAPPLNPNDPSLAADLNMFGGVDTGFDLALMPDTYFDAFWDFQLDGLNVPNLYP